MKKLFAFLLIIALFSCTHHSHKQKIECYRQHTVDDNGNDAWLYWYILGTLNSSNSYYYSSSSPISDYSSVSWNQSTPANTPNLQDQTFEPMPEQVVENQDLSTEMQQEINDNPENFGGMTQDEMGDYEGGGNDNTSDNSSNDGGSSDGGGSDSGGDSGGGGE